MAEPAGNLPKTHGDPIGEIHRCHCEGDYPELDRLGDAGQVRDNRHCEERSGEAISMT
jgi:hypothetical protein